MENNTVTEITNPSSPTCRLYHCYKQYDDLVCKLVHGEHIPLHSPYTDIICIEPFLPPCMDYFLLKYNYIPKNVYRGWR